MSEENFLEEKKIKKLKENVTIFFSILAFLAFGYSLIFLIVGFFIDFYPVTQFKHFFLSGTICLFSFLTAIWCRVDSI